jgi:hypothetical protein
MLEAVRWVSWICSECFDEDNELWDE